MTVVGLPTLCFTPAQLGMAWRAWGCNCGPTALAVILGITLDRAHEAIPQFDERQYTNPSMMLQALKSLGVRFAHRWARDSGVVWPPIGLARIQWDGPWCRGGVPIQARYRHSHWVATAIIDGMGTFETQPGHGIFDCNCPHWISFYDWQNILIPHILRENEPKASGKWWVTNAIEVLQ